MFKKRLRSLRLEQGLTQKALGEIIGIAESTISHYETGIRNPDNATLLKLAEFFQVTTDYLLGLTDSRLGFIPGDYPERELEKFLHSGQVSYRGANLDTQDIKDIIAFTRMLCKRKEPGQKA